MRKNEFDITALDRHEPGFNARSGFGQKARKKKMEGIIVKHSDEFISYLGYRVLWWNALCERDYEKSCVYMNEMSMILDKMNTKEMLEAVKQSDIMDTIYRNRSC